MIGVAFTAKTARRLTSHTKARRSWRLRLEPRLLLVNKQYGGKIHTEVVRISYFLVKTVMRNTHGFSAYDLNGG